jgi:hypothetical protein
VSAANYPHPSQDILAISTSGVAYLVYYLYGAAQAVALAARATGTPFNPRSLDLPSIGALVGFDISCLQMYCTNVLFGAPNQGQMLGA